MFDKYKPDFRMQFPLMNLLMEHLQEVEKDARKRQATFEHPELELEHPPADPGWTVSSVLLDWLRTIVLKNWDGKAEVKRWEPVGAAIEFMAHLCVYERPHFFPNGLLTYHRQTPPEPWTEH